MKPKIISPRNIPLQIPIIPTLFWWLFLDYVNAPGWAFGVMGCLMFIVWVGWFLQFFSAEVINIDQPPKK